ncbi:energy transducer TonB [Hydrogenophaga sp. OTU3427]|uniref:energy transducer TonB n=1 Tax=Hydrogenophaga sp. OTU3427 TaxID=3043856 RepID=UPI00313E0A3D
MTRSPLLPRNTAIALGVVALHVGGLWALQSGLLRRAVELVVPAEVLVEFIEPAKPIITPPPPAPRVKPQPVQQAPRQPAPLPPLPVATPDPTPAPDAPTGTSQPQPPAPPITAPVATAPPAPAPADPPAPPRIELPSSNADYLNNPRPAYPPLSKRLGEQGKVVVRVFIETNGSASKAEIAQSSGFDRLDQTALDTVRRWRYVPGKRAGTPEAMWFNVPINFVLE